MTEQEPSTKLPRLVVAGLAGDSGKTLVALGLVRALRSRGFRVAPFKKGPDFIDAAWLGAAAARAGRNLDTYLCLDGAVVESVARASQDADVAVIEGNRGLFDGLDADGSHSTARLAKLIGAPVVLVIDATKVTATVAAMVLGCQKLDPELNLAGVILNRVGTARQEKVIREAVTKATGVPVLGCIPKLKERNLPSRHLGLVTAVEHRGTNEVLDRLGAVLEEHAAVSDLLAIARTAPELPGPREPRAPRAEPVVRVGVLKDRAFSFYYPENLEALEAAGAQLVNISPLDDEELPDIDALYAGGGFPEVYAERISDNVALREQLAERIAQGLPVWAECGGLGYLAEAWIMDGVEHPMVGALPIKVQQQKTPQGHGYVAARVDANNPFLAEGTELRGHEFHYSQVVGGAGSLETALKLTRGTGVGDSRDGIVVGNVIATYAHLHALGTPEWAERLVAVARQTEMPRHAARRPTRAARRGVVARQRPSLRERGEQRVAQRLEATSRLGRSRRAKRGRLSTEVRELVESGSFDELARLAEGEPRVVRYLLGLTYQADEGIRQAAARGMAIASRYHPGLVQNVVRRLIWAMNDESGTNALNAPDVLQAIAEENAELLLPTVPDLVRLAADDGLREGLAATLRTVAKRCPGRVGSGLSASLTKRTREGGTCGIS